MMRNSVWKTVPLGTLAMVLLVGVTPGRADLNSRILETIGEMPSGGGYARYRSDLPEGKRFDDLREVVERLNRAVSAGRKGDLSVTPRKASKPSFCSSATYLLFVEVVEDLQEEGKIQPDPSLSKALAEVGNPVDVIAGKLDGVGIFGHWNADGPGTAVLFERLDLGSNFLGFEKAKPGDFLKIFWNEHIGKDERGHLVVYLGDSEDGDSIQVWSSNLKNSDGSSGYGTMWVEKSRIHRALFSRLERPENLVRWLEFGESEQRSDYLIRIRKTGSSEEEMRQITKAE